MSLSALRLLVHCGVMHVLLKAVLALRRQCNIISIRGGMMLSKVSKGQAMSSPLPTKSNLVTFHHKVVSIPLGEVRRQSCLVAT